ncbi:URE2 protein [Trichodelitschia bisporula]|uniref:URE2 protein n=1 Tax=Trichodelitschia bisporula TaxID=703511 RepID=A0A6G1HJ85_9PEZI|nr:URE2 protein [Trichodelitschia bisporula]
MTLQPITLYGHGPTRNPIKVAVLLEELGLPYVIKSIDYEKELKFEPYISINPNGRLPAIEDPNTGVKMFESGAICEYLVETYDTEGRLTYTTSPEKWLLKSWLHFQMSGQGPYWGQLFWFKFFHEEKNLTSAITRYENEAKRVIGVIDAHLTKKGGRDEVRYLVGDKITYVDLAWLTWNTVIDMMFPEGTWDWKTEVPAFAKWHLAMLERPAVQKTLGLEAFQKK